MFFTDYPYSKYSYGDEKCSRNEYEVNAVMMAAEELGYKCYAVDSHNWYVFVEADDDSSRQKIQELLQAHAISYTPEQVYEYYCGNIVTRWGLFGGLLDEPYIEFIKQFEAPTPEFWSRLETIEAKDAEIKGKIAQMLFEMYTMPKVSE